LKELEGFEGLEGLVMFEGFEELAAVMQLVEISFAPDKKSGQAVRL